MDTYTHELHIATLAVHHASKITKMMQSAVDKGSRDKEDASPVTVADFAAQAILISALRHHFPGDQFVGEESAAALRGDPELVERVWELVSAMKHGETNMETETVSRELEHGQMAEEIQAAIPATRDEMLRVIDLGGDGEGMGDGRTWILDPIDGTATFIRGQQFAVAVALVVDGEQRVGVVGYPNLKDGGKAKTAVYEDSIDDEGYGLLVCAVKGRGASKRAMLRSGLQPAEKLVQGRTDELVFAESLASPYINLERQRAVRDRLQATAPITDLWSMQVKYGALIVGACTAMVRIPKRDHRPWAWDHAGGMLVYEESGGKITDLHGSPFHYRGRKLMDNVGLVAALPEVHAHVLKVARQVSEEPAEM